MSKPVLTVVNSPVVSLDRAKSPSAGGWLTAGKTAVKDARERLGLSAQYPGPDVTNTSGHYAFYVENRQLMPKQYWKLYKTSPDIRACVDSIVRRIATWDWYVKPTTDPRDTAEYERLSEAAKTAQAFLKVPNENGDTWQETMTALVTDLLVYDAGALELVPNQEGELAELVAWLGSEWFPVTDDHGRILSYRQESETNGKGIEVTKERLAYFKLFSNTRSSIGLPLMESCLNEVLSVLLSSELAMLSMDADEVPPGLLVLGGVAGAAAERARADLQAMRGKDNRIRVITSPQATGINAQWVEMRHTPKELEMFRVVKEMRRCIWRVFGVMPVEMGEIEGVPRASAQVQMDVASSHLITPILELLQARINSQILPRLLADEDKGKVQFSFSRDFVFTAEEKLAEARRSEILVKRGILTVNEVRDELGFMPVDGGDIPIVDTSMGPMPLTDLSDGAFFQYQGMDTEAAPTGQTAEGESRSSTCSHKSSLQLRDSANGWLPSDWQSAGKFNGYRTLPLEELASLVSDYGAEVTSIYRETASECESIVVSAYSIDGQITPQNAASAQTRVERALDELLAKWHLITYPIYRKATEMGYGSASDFLSDRPEMDLTRKADMFAQEAMQYLGDEVGLVGTLKQSVRQIISNATLSQRSRITDVTPEVATSAVASVVAKTFKAQEFRIENWSGKLVSLSTNTLVETLNSVAEVTDERAVVWMYEWVSQSGKNCITCASEGAGGFRYVQDLAVYPTQDTRCGARCRCVLVFWTQEEVENGSARSFA